MRKIMGLLLIIASSSALAVDWNCRNHDMEISCSSEECEVSDGFTPMDVYFGDEGNMSLGAYTGVWEGVGKVLKQESYTVVIGKNLRFSTSNSDDMNADFIIAIDTKDKVAVIKGAGYAMPMTCVVYKKENK